MLIHRMWLGPRPMPMRFREFGARWKELNPAAEVIEWSWHNLPGDMANRDVMDDIRSRCTQAGSAELPVALADVMCYDLVARFGGMYVNCDLDPVRPLSALGDALDGAWIASWDDASGPLGTVNAALGGPRQDPFWLSVVRLLNVRYWRERAAGEQRIPNLTGNYLTAEAIGANPGAVRILPREAFNPVHLDDVPWGTGLPPFTLPAGAVAVHHWDHRRTGRTNYVT